MIYLASPYSHPDAAVREQRFREACRAAAALLRAGHSVFSPIAYSHALVAHGLPSDWSFWERHDREMLTCCEEVVVLAIDGWTESVGVQAEIALAHALGKPLWLVEPSLVDRWRTPTLAHAATEVGT